MITSGVSASLVRSGVGAGNGPRRRCSLAPFRGHSLNSVEQSVWGLGSLANGVDELVTEKAVEFFVRRGDAEALVDDVRGDDEEIAATLRWSRSIWTPKGGRSAFGPQWPHR